MRCLDYCHADSDLIRTHLLEYCDYDESDIHQLRLASEAPVTSLSGHGGREMARQTFFSRLHATLGTYQDSIAPRSFLFFFAGHGVATGDRSYIALPDSDCATADSTERTAVPIYAIGDALRARARGAPIFRILDACHSGQFSRDRSTDAPAQTRESEAFLTGIKRDQRDNSNWSTLAACSERNLARESEALKHGIFTHHVCEAIVQSAPGEIYFSELHRRVSASICEWRQEHDDSVADSVLIERTEGPPCGFAERRPHCGQTRTIAELPFDIGPSLGVEDPLSIERDVQTRELTLTTSAAGGIKMGNHTYASIPLRVLSDSTIYLPRSVLRLSLLAPSSVLVAEKIYPSSQEIKFRITCDGNKG
jgi:hypothetical protein